MREATPYGGESAAISRLPSHPLFCGIPTRAIVAYPAPFPDCRATRSGRGANPIPQFSNKRAGRDPGDTALSFPARRGFRLGIRSPTWLIAGVVPISYTAACLKTPLSRVRRALCRYGSLSGQGSLRDVGSLFRLGSLPLHDSVFELGSLRGCFGRDLGITPSAWFHLCTRFAEHFGFGRFAGLALLTWFGPTSRLARFVRFSAAAWLVRRFRFDHVL
jgi:hypothetical protein